MRLVYAALPSERWAPPASPSDIRGAHLVSLVTAIRLQVTDPRRLIIAIEGGRVPVDKWMGGDGRTDGQTDGQWVNGLIGRL